MTVKERLKKFIGLEDITIKAFEESLGMSNGYVNSISKGIGDVYMHRLVENYPNLNLTWLLTGEGEMLNSSSSDDIAVGKYIADEEDFQKAVEMGLNLIPEYSGNLRGGNNGEMSIGEHIVAYWGFPSDIKANAIMEIDGDSMADKYPAGSKVALREIYFDREFPTAGISFGDAFGIILDNGDEDYIRYIKILRRHPDPTYVHKYWIAQSVNREKYDDFEIEIARVKHLFRVVLCITPDRI